MSCPPSKCSFHQPLSPSSSSSSSPIIPHSSSSSPRKTMDEVWKDLSLSTLHHHQHSINRAEASIPLASIAPPPPPTLLSLNSRPDFHYIDNSDHMAKHSHLHNNVTPFITPFNVLAAASPLLPSIGKKRPRGSEDNAGDRRRKRLIKNRESAARSRARKQAYTTELELEVDHLVKENTRLRKLQQKLCPVAPAQLPKKHTLYRTSTAPF